MDISTGGLRKFHNDNKINKEVTFRFGKLFKFVGKEI